MSVAAAVPMFRTALAARRPAAAAAAAAAAAPAWRGICQVHAPRFAACTPTPAAGAVARARRFAAAAASAAAVDHTGQVKVAHILMVWPGPRARFPW